MKTNKRVLKKEICRKCGDVAGECIYGIETAATPDDACKWTDLVFRCANLQFETLSQCTFAFDKTRKEVGDGHLYRKMLHDYRRKAYGKLMKEFNEKLAAIVTDMNSLLTPEQRECNKAAVRG